MTTEAPPTTPAPPSPERRPHVLRAHGDERIDEWYWLADRADPAVIAHLRAENDHTDAALAHLAGLRADLYQEMVARIDETDLSVPVRRGPWWYYERTEEGKSYPVHCRRPAGPDGEAPPTGEPPAGVEQVLLDENALAEGREYLQVANLAVSPDHRWLAYAVDSTGAERFELRFRRVASAPSVAGDGARDGAREGARTVDAAESVPDTYYGLAWANDNATVFYTRVDDAMRPHQLWRHHLGDDPSEDVLVMEEPDERFVLQPGRTKNGCMIVIALHSTTTSEVWIIPADTPEASPRVVEPRREGVEYHIDHLRTSPDGPGRLLVVTNDGAEDFRLMAVGDGDPGRRHWREVLPHRPGTRLQDVDVFDRWLVVDERLDGEARLRVVPLRSDVQQGADPLGGDLLGRSWLVEASEHPSTTWAGANPEPASEMLRLEQTSLVSPRAVSDLTFATGEASLRKRQRVLGGYEPSCYRTFRLWATAEDGTRVPMSVVHRADLLADQGAPPGTPPAEPAPCLLYGYGAYEHSIDPVFSSLRLSLLDRGFVFAVAHVRGGGELGRRWYEGGKLLAKPHTFTDFVACARHLVDAGFTVPGQMAARGGSAGGLLIGAVANLAPDLFAALVAEVPFVDCLTTMLDASLPLTVGEWDEWGNPVTDPAAYAVMRSYSPYDNVRSRTVDGSPLRYPDILATAGLNDNRVGYWEPAKWVTKLRAANPANRVLLRTELGAGHGGPSGRYDAWRDEALVYSFLLDALGVVTGEPDGSSPAP
ncbi:MAG TPA: S9 family peptidase [Acidimicrobiales bacterium]|nr:S9 family peptidase [Acidimicrobiales bacterium]